MSEKQDFKDCTEELEHCLKQLKNITRRISSISHLAARSAICKVKQGTEELQHLIEKCDDST